MEIMYWRKKINIQIYCPSYKRDTNSVFSHYIFNWLNYVIWESEAKNYKWLNFIKVDDKYQWNLCRIRNYILDNLEWDVKILVDDDYKKLWMFEYWKASKLNKKEIDIVLKKMIVLCLDLWCNFFGVNVNTWRQNYREYSPFSLSSVVLWPFQWFIKPSEHNIRYDEKLYLKEDFDISLQFLKKDRKILRFNKYHYLTLQSENKWWCASYRTLEEEKKNFDLLVKKWGSNIVKKDKLSKKDFDYNPIIKCPIWWI